MEQQKVRLSKEEIENIKKIIKKYDPQAQIFLFGSRIDPSKKGGDIDLLVVSNNLDYKKKRLIKTDLHIALGDRKIDLIVVDNPDKSEFTKQAYKSGVEL